MYIDGADMRAGDGVFINSSCSPNAMLHPCYVLHDEDVAVLDSEQKVHPRRVRNMILVFRPLRYVQPRLLNVKSLYSTLSAHEEVTVFYNNPEKLEVRLNAAVGGCFPLSKCACGCRFCMGDILRRLKWGLMSEMTRYFFVKDKTGALAMNSESVKNANELCKYNVNTDDEAKKKLEMLFGDINGFMTVSDVRALFRKLPLRKVFPPSFMKCSH